MAFILIPSYLIWRIFLWPVKKLPLDFIGQFWRQLKEFISTCNILKFGVLLPIVTVEEQGKCPLVLGI